MAKNFLDDALGPIGAGIARVLEQGASGGAIKKIEPKKILTSEIIIADPNAQSIIDNKEQAMSLEKSILNVLNGGKNSIARLAFEVDPSEVNQVAGIYQRKTVLLPDDILKRLAIQDNLVAAIINARRNHVASFGRKRPDKYSTGFTIDPIPGLKEEMSPEEKEDFDKKVKKAERRLTTCGATEFFGSEERYTTFSQYLSMSVRDALTVGRIATEIVWVLDSKTGDKKFHAFRPIDAGTIYRCIDQGAQAEEVRQNAKLLIEQIHNENFKEEPKTPEHFEWVQVIKGKPQQVFTDKECAVHIFYPVTNVELNGYPVTPLDTVMSAVTTHLNIEEHNKLYFQSGRAARGMLLITSESIDQGVIDNIRQQFQASINSVQNSWRAPIFGLDSGSTITWQPIESAGRDMEFQYLSDSNARVILSAFQMSPEELPGYAHLSRGTNSQALSEASNEYKLEAARDVGLRPLLSQFEDFVNARIFPLIDPELAKICVVKFVGLDAETPEKEAQRLTQDMVLHYTYDQVLGQMEKKTLGLELGGEYPLNPAIQQVMEKFLTKGFLLEKFFGVKDASKDPKLAYCMGDEVDVQRYLAELGAGQQQDPQAAGQPGEITSALDQTINALSKSEKDGNNLPPSRRRLFAQQKAIVRDTMKHWEDESKATIASILAEVDKLKKE